MAVEASSAPGARPAATTPGLRSAMVTISRQVVIRVPVDRAGGPKPPGRMLNSETLGVVLKHHSDTQKAAAELRLN